MILFCDENDMQYIDKQIIESFLKLMNVMVAKEIKKLPNGHLRDQLLPIANAWIESLQDTSIQYFNDVKDIDDLLMLLNYNESITINAITKAYQLLSLNHLILSSNINRQEEFDKLISRIRILGMQTNILKSNEDGIVSSDLQTWKLRNIYRVVLIGYHGLKSKGKIK